MDRNTHKKLIADFLSSGGDPAKVKLITSFSLQNHAKLKSFIKHLAREKETETEIFEELEVKPIFIQDKIKPKSIFSDLISNYPSELHPVFKNRYDYWLEACSLKQQLNEVERLDEETALEIQWKILDNIDSMDECQKALDYYKEHKRILSTISSENFDDLSAIELLKKRNNLRSNITKRTKTLKKMELELPPENDPDYKLRLHLVNRKREQLQEYNIQVIELDKLINK